MNQSIDLDGAYIPERENKFSDKISCLKKDNIAIVSSLLQVGPFLASYHVYHPSLEIILRIFNFLAISSEALPGPLRLQ